MGEQDKLAFLERSVLPQMTEHTMPFITQVIGVVDERHGEFLGTGFFCDFAGRQSVVTAAHILRKAGESRRYRSLALSRGDGLAPGIVPGKIIYSDPSDLAIYLPDWDLPLGVGKSFWPDDRIDVSRANLTSDYLFLQGFPARFSRRTSFGGDAIASETLAYGAMMRYREGDIPVEERAQFDVDLPAYEFLPDEFLSPHQFALNFSQEPAVVLEPEAFSREGRKSVVEDWAEVFRPAGEVETLPGQKPRGAYGLSGSPVWRVGASGRSLAQWTPDASELVGIVTAWNADRRILIATYADRLIEKVASEFRDEAS